MEGTLADSAETRRAGVMELIEIELIEVGREYRFADWAEVPRRGVPIPLPSDMRPELPAAAAVLAPLTTVSNTSVG
jgi:hypothetical protein